MTSNSYTFLTCEIIVVYRESQLDKIYKKWMLTFEITIVIYKDKWRMLKVSKCCCIQLINLL